MVSYFTMKKRRFESGKWEMGSRKWEVGKRKLSEAKSRTAGRDGKWEG
jgi:hypothetical protein